MSLLKNIYASQIEVHKKAGPVTANRSDSPTFPSCLHYPSAHPLSFPLYLQPCAASLSYFQAHTGQVLTPVLLEWRFPKPVQVQLPEHWAGYGSSVRAGLDGCPELCSLTSCSMASEPGRANNSCEL